MQGCLHNCFGCHNPETHALDGGKIVDTEFLINEMKKNPLLTGITLSGGEPLLQIAPALELAKSAKNLGLNVWCYTGYTFEKIPASAEELIKNIDVLIDGPYIESLRDLDLQFRGSKNQRIIDLNKTRRLNRLSLWTN